LKIKLENIISIFTSPQDQISISSAMIPKGGGDEGDSKYFIFRF
jgi:hypothetical protein